MIKHAYVSLSCVINLYFPFFLMKQGQEVEPPKKANKNSTDKNTSVSNNDQTVPQQSQVIKGFCTLCT